MAYTGVDNYAKPHGSGKTNGGSTRIQIINKGGKNNFDPNYINVNTLDAHNGNIDNLYAKSATINNASFKYIMSPNGIINKIEGDEVNYKLGRIDDLSSSNIGTTKLTVHDEANIKNLINEYLTSKEIVTDKLTVNKTAHFFELIIDKIRSVQGSQMNTAANCIIDYVEAYDVNDDLLDINDPDFDEYDVEYYRIYWKNESDGRSTTNDWLQYDQAICESFNVNTGASYDKSNKYYWRLVNRTDGGTVKYINFNTKQVVNTQPASFEITFSNISYGDNTDPTDNYTNFNINPQIIGELNPITLTWTPSSTLYGVQLTVNPNDGIILASGGLIFETDIPTKLNIGIYYDDGTYAYFQSNEYKNNYNITTAQDKNAEAFIICVAEIDKWEACHWIDLSNTICDIGLYGKESIPSAGDNICQLGYRYDMLPGYENTSAWRQAHKGDIARASAIIIAAYETPDVNVFPPSYAQYQDITRFILGDWSEQGIDYSNRGTYFDATGAYIKGTLVAGTTVESGVQIPITVDDWRLKADTSVITKDANNTIQPSTITLSLLYNNGSTSTEITTLPLDKKLYVNGQDNSVQSPSNPLLINTSYYGFTTYDIELKSYNGTPQIFDKLVIDKFDINATNGKNGSFIQFIYKNDSESPSTPSQDAFPPSGWTTSPSSLLPDEYTWMSQRTVSYTAANVEQHSSWTSPIRISGENGEAGADGDGVEFIYYITEDDTPPSLFNSYIDIQSPSLLDDHTIQYLIRPGDAGYDTAENLIRLWREGLTTHNYYNNDYLPPSYQSGSTLSTGWTDEPQGVDDTYLYEWVAVRTYDGAEHKWGAFSEPVIWAKYGENGVNGVDGINGIDGKNGEGWFLVPIVHDFNVNIKSSTNYDNIVGVVRTNFKFGIQHIDGDTSEWLTTAELEDYSLNLMTNNTYGRNTCRSTDTQQASQVTFEITTVTVDGNAIPVISVTSPNYLRYTSNVQTDENSYGNYYNLHKHINDSDPSYRNAMFTQVTIQLVRTGIGIMDTYTQLLLFEPDHIFAAADDALNSVYQGISGDSNPLAPGSQFSTGFSKIRQAWDNINLNVNNLTTFSKLPTSNEITEYAWYRKQNTTPPTKPNGEVQTNSDVSNNWTTYKYPYPSYAYPYMYMTQRTRSQNAYSYYGSWGEWSTPVVIYTYSGGLASAANSATLDIKADQIQSTVAQTYLTQDAASRTYTTMSQVTQTATSISAQVKTDIEGELKSTGIDIENGKITLNADATEINGNTLTMNQNQGLLITDGDTFNNIVIKASDIEAFGTDVKYSLTYDTDLFGKVVNHYNYGSSPDTYTWTWTDNYFEIGYLYANSVVKLQDYEGRPQVNTYLIDNSYPNTTLASINWAETYIPTITLYIKSGNTYTAVYDEWDVNSSFNINTAGHYYIGIGDVSFTYSPLNNNGKDAYAKVVTNFDVTAKGNNNIQIGTNGYNVIINNNTTVNNNSVNYDFVNYMNKDEWAVEDKLNSSLTASRDRTGLKINSTRVPLQKASYNYDGLKYDAWVTVGSIMRIFKSNTTTYNVSRDYDMYIFEESGSKTLNMSITQNTVLPAGKIIYVKNMASGTVNCNAGSGHNILYNLNSSSGVSSITLNEGAQGIFLFDGSHYIRLA